MSEPKAPTPPPVAQTDHHNALQNDRPVELPNVAGGDASRHIPTPNLLSATQISNVLQVNVGLGGKIGIPDGSDDWKVFLNATATGVTSEGGGGTPGIMLDALEFGACQRNFPAQTPATNSFTNFNRQSLMRRRARSVVP